MHNDLELGVSAPQARHEPDTCDEQRNYQRLADVPQDTSGTKVHPVRVSEIVVRQVQYSLCPAVSVRRGQRDIQGNRDVGTGQRVHLDSEPSSEARAIDGRTFVRRAV